MDFPRKEASPSWVGSLSGLPEPADAADTAAVADPADIADPASSDRDKSGSHALFENRSEGVFLQKADGRIEEVNDVALRMIGLSRDQALGRTSYDPAWCVVDESGVPLCPEKHPSMLAILSGESVRDFILGVYNPKMAGINWLKVNAVPRFRRGETKPFEVIVTLCDISRPGFAGDDPGISDNFVSHSAMSNT